MGAELSTGKPTLSLEARARPLVVCELRALEHDVQLIARDPATQLLRGATELCRPPCTLLGW